MMQMTTHTENGLYRDVLEANQKGAEFLSLHKGDNVVSPKANSIDQSAHVEIYREGGGAIAPGYVATDNRLFVIRGEKHYPLQPSNKIHIMPTLVLQATLKHVADWMPKAPSLAGEAFERDVVRTLVEDGFVKGADFKRAAASIGSAIFSLEKYLSRPPFVPQDAQPSKTPG